MTHPSWRLQRTIVNGGYSGNNAGEIRVGTFDGSDDYISTGATLLPATADFDLSMDVYFDSLSTISKYFFGQYTTGVAGRCWLAARSDTGVNFSFNGGVNLFTGASTLVTETWYTVRVTRVSNNFTLYLDGVSKATGASAGSIEQTTTTVGSVSLGTVPWHQGRMANFVLDGVTGYAINEGSGDTVGDNIGSNNGTIVNAVTTANTGFWANTF